MALEKREPGNPIRSEEWNELTKLAKDLQKAQQTLQDLATSLQNDKLNTTGGTVSGTLLANILKVGSLRSQGLGVEFVKPPTLQWDYSTNSTEYRTLISKQLFFDQPTSVLVIGHGAGVVQEKNSRIDVAVFCDGVRQMADGPQGFSWGMGFLSAPLNSSNHTGQVITLAKCTVDRGPHTFDLRFRSPMAIPTGKEIIIYLPTMWLLKLGDFS